jgi:hypothetical protein
MRRALLLLAVCAVTAACAGSRPTPAGSAASPSTAGPGATASPSVGGPSPSRLPDAAFPAQVVGLPVVSVAHAIELLDAGRLDGQAVAVAGYYNQMALPCPYPGRYIGPLESWCRLVAFTDTRAGAQLCQSSGAGVMSCGQPSGTNLAPWFMGETSGDPSSWLAGGATGEADALVLVGHAGDARQWQCTAATQAQCASAFVVDRVAWAQGHEVPAAAPQTGDQLTGKVVTPRMTLAQVSAAIGLGNDLLTGAAFRKGDVATVDPRWNFAGDDIVWLVRSLGPATGAGAGATRPETVWLVDDATGKVIDSHPLQLAAAYRPARLWQVATAHGVGCCAGDVLAFHRVASRDGTVVYDGMLAGGMTGDAESTTYGGSGPLVLPAGGYSITAWLAPYANGVTGTPRDECSTQVALQPLGDVALKADFPSGKSCAFGPAPLPTSGP